MLTVLHHNKPSRFYHCCVLFIETTLVKLVALLCSFESFS